MILEGCWVGRGSRENRVAAAVSIHDAPIIVEDVRNDDGGPQRNPRVTDRIEPASYSCLPSGHCTNEPFEKMIEEENWVVLPPVPIRVRSVEPQVVAPLPQEPSV